MNAPVPPSDLVSRALALDEFRKAMRECEGIAAVMVLDAYKTGYSAGLVAGQRTAAAQAREVAADLAAAKTAAP